MLSETEKLNALTQLGVQLNEVNDLDILLERVLTEARRFTRADAGSIYIAQAGQLDFSYTQNDTLQKRLGPGEKLIYSTFTLPIDVSSIAGFVASTGQSLLLDDVYSLPEASPYGFSREFDQTARYKTTSMLTIPLKTSRNSVLGVLQVINAQDEKGGVRPFDPADEAVMRHFASLASVALERAQMTRALILRMISMAEMRDPKETGAHVNRVGAVAVEIYEQWALRQGVCAAEIEKNRDTLRMAAMLHDVGKVAISDLILKKPGRFDDNEFEIMKQHTWLGARLFSASQSDLDDAAGQVALTHHERWDGEGYPGHVHPATGAPLAGYETAQGGARGKKGADIPLYGRIVALADVYDALSSVRIYKEAWSEQKTLAIIEEEAGAQFDPVLVEIFFNHIDTIRSVRLRYADKEPNAQ